MQLGVWSYLRVAHSVTLASRNSCSCRSPGETMSVRGLLRLITAPSTPAWTISSSLQGVWQACSPINCSCSSLVWTKHYHHPLLHCTAPLAVSFTSRETFLFFSSVFAIIFFRPALPPAQLPLQLSVRAPPGCGHS